MFKGGYVYMMTNMHHTVLYVGVTSDIIGRVYQHKDHTYKSSFTDRYNVEKLVYYEFFDGIEDAITREKQIKKYRREKKLALINQMNPKWNDLWNELF
jgi:putative endonuclease